MQNSRIGGGWGNYRWGKVKNEDIGGVEMKIKRENFI